MYLANQSCRNLKMPTTNRLHLFLLLLPAALAACSSPPAPSPAPAPAPMAASVAPPPKPVAVSTPAPAPKVVPAYLDPESDISKKRSVFFDFDQSLIRSQDEAVVELQGRYLAQHPELKVRVEGNTDERGGSEYNLALGQRRAEAVAKAMELIGVKYAQVEAVSFGKERPRAPGHDEASWAQNRRADVAYPPK
jgi:peptidoglycan-associated lipoprotein